MEHGRSPLSDNYGGWTHSTVCHTTHQSTLKTARFKPCGVTPNYCALSCGKLVATAQKYWSKAYANTMQPHTGGFPCTVQLTHNLHMRWHERGEHNIPAPLWAFFVNDRSDTVSIHGPVIQFIQQLKLIKLDHFWNLNIFNSCPTRSML